MDRVLEICEWCKATHGNGDAHVCVDYDPGVPCQTPGCGEPTVYVIVGAPGVGEGRECRAGHFHGSSRLLESWEVV